ncbi:ATP-binding protein [Devosia sp. MC1541]|uniref:ATP-dependent nuclease n=1 Tax=Devosia sp. MC1541 TaxID=2725264 RepID=UPI00145EA1EB|nr:ATP-binding protein [Devosia sp. MC1541]
MPAIREVEIHNFRGICHLKWWPNPGINCLIGPGDAGKSTVLDAIELTLSARQSTGFTDADFHLNRVSEPIVIDVTIGNLDEDFRNLELYGHFLRGRNVTTGAIDNEPSSALETVRTLRLVVRDDLEPEWSLFSPGPAAEGRERNLQWKHRQKLAPVRLGTSASHHLALGPRSVLGKLSADVTQASAALADASRQARRAFAERGFEGIDAILQTSRAIANDMGIPVEKVQALLDVRGAALSGGAISLHDEDQVPLKGLGTGSSRLLVAGLQKSAGRSGIFIIDEVEFGLEPFRIVRLLDSLGAKRDDQSQQVFLTTHSPVVLRELSSVQLFALGARRSTTAQMPGDGMELRTATKTTQHWIAPLGRSEAAQKTLRTCAEAFLAPSVIVCEGKTEIGLVRGIDLWCQDNNLRSVVAQGCHWADGGGSSMFERAEIFAGMGYRTALFMDSDVTYPPEKYRSLHDKGVSVFRWSEGLSTEAALFASVPAGIIGHLLDIACDWRSEDAVDAKIRHLSGGKWSLAMCRTNFGDQMRGTLGQAAGDGKWFKDIEPAERVLRHAVFPVWDQTVDHLRTPVNALWHWIAAAPSALPTRSA